MKMYTNSCPCGFSIGSHRKGEVVEFSRTHIAKVHRKRMSSAQVAENVRTRGR